MLIRFIGLAPVLLFVYSMKFSTLRILFLLAVIFLFTACSSNKFAGFEKGENEVKYKVHISSDDTIHPKLTDWVTVNMDYRLEDTVLFSSANLDKPLMFSIIEPMFKGDLYDGLKMMSVGDSMTFAVVADSFFFKTAFAKKLPDFVEAGSPLFYDVKLTQLLTDEEFKLEMESEKQILKDKEQQILNAYLKENNIKTQPLESGLYFIPVKEGKGSKPDTGDMCRIYLEVKEINGDVLFSNFDGTPIDAEFGKQFDTEGLMQGLGMLRPGGRAKLIVPSSIGVGETGKEMVESFTTILYDVELIEIKTVTEVKQERRERKAAMEAEKDRIKEMEPMRLEAYLQNNNITVSPTSSGLYFLTIEEGSGSNPVAGDTVRLYYTVGKTDGRVVYDSREKGEPIEFVLGLGMVVKAWDEGITYMARGGKYKLVAPSKLAYGRKGQGELIGPYEPLIYDIELIEEE